MLWQAGQARRATTKEEVFNSLSVELLCDFVYAVMVEGRNDEERRDFDDALEEAGESGMSDRDKLRQKIGAMKARGDVGGLQ